MTLTPDQFYSRIDALNKELGDQATLVCTLAEDAFNSFLMTDRARADRAIQTDDQVDESDVRIERQTVDLLVEAAGAAVPLPPEAMRSVLTLVKLNDAYESIADAAVAIAETTTARCNDGITHSDLPFPPTSRVMTNSVIGMLRDAAVATQKRDATLARIVLQMEDTIIAFKAEILRQAERQVAEGTMTVELAFDVHELATQCMVMTEHATSVAEHIIFETTGVIVRHQNGTWIDVNN